MRVRWPVSLAVVVACGGDARKIGSDAGGEELRAEAGADAAQSDVCSTGVRRVGFVEYALPLEDLCQLLATDGRVACPASRRDLIESSVDCGPDTSFPVLRRHCGTDIYFFAPSPTLLVTWTFDADSGALTAARVVGDGFPCGQGNYVSGPAFGTCDGPPDVYCRLCESSAERDLECPADVVAALPGEACEEPATAPGCTCDNPGSSSFADLPPEGAPCGSPDACPNCQSGTCWASCVCALDGVFRWNLECTE